MRPNTAPLPLIVLMLLLACPAPRAQAQSQEEMRTLALFYPKEELVVTPTRNPKPVSQVAENITVVTAEEIEAMNAHTVAEVLHRVPGVFVNFSQDFGATSLLGIQGSEDRHVLVLLDGIRWNFLAGANAETNNIPVDIVDRIEIIKGPASSAWGSSLGGVVNIITKPTGFENGVHGEARLSYGEAAATHAGAQAWGRKDTFGFYVYGGMQSGDGLRGDRAFDAGSLFSKCDLGTREARLSVSAGYSAPENDLGRFPSQDIHQTSDNSTFFANAALDLKPGSRRALNINCLLFFPGHHH